MLFLAKSTTVVHTDARTEQKRKQFRTGTSAPRRRLDSVVSAARTHRKDRALDIAATEQVKLTTGIAIAFIRKAVRMMVDIVEIKSAVRSGEITVYEETGRLYMENRAGEKIELKPKDSISRREGGDTSELEGRSNQ